MPTDPYQSAALELSNLISKARELLATQAVEAGMSGQLTFATPAQKPNGALCYEFLLHDGLAVGLVQAVWEGTEVKVRTSFGCP